MSRLQNSPYFCVFKYARAVKQKVWNDAENRERDWGETLTSHALRACKARALRARKTLTPRFTDFSIDLFRLYVLFSQYRSCDNTLENFFFKFRLIHVHIYAQFMKRPRVMFPWDLYWENKIYKLKRSILSRYMG